MPLIVAGDDRYVSDFHDALLRQAPFEVGVVFGFPSAGRHAILRLVRTPDATEGRAAKSAKQLDAEWVAAHASQLNLALPGGTAALGFYVSCKTAELKDAEAALAQPLRKLVAGGRLAGCGSLLLHFPTDARKLAARVCPAADAGRLEVAELKLGKAMPPLHRFDALWALNVAFSLTVVPRDSPAKRAAAIAAAVSAALHPSLEALRRAVPTVDGEPVLDVDAPVSKLPAAALKAPRSTVKWFSRTPTPDSADADGSSAPTVEETEGASAQTYEVRAVGTVHLRAYAQPKESVGGVLDSLRTDAARSLDRRLQLLREQLVDELEENEGEEEAKEEDNEHARAGALVGRSGVDVRPLARRVFFDLALGGGVDAMDLRALDDDDSDVAERLALATGAEVDAAQLRAAVAAGGDLEALTPLGELLAEHAQIINAGRAKAAASCEPRRAATAGASGSAAGAPPTRPAAAASRLPLVAAAVVVLVAALAAVGLGGGTAATLDPAAHVRREIKYPDHVEPSATAEEAARS
ncbi:olfactory receptor 4-like-domain-containing protein [Pavlovales sp. CCMP2436]|nr:olfactory receptor 4-like-domain-containing protein [Pavlovales sp. CCMP2436]